MKVMRNTTWDTQLGARMQRQMLIALGGGIVSAMLLVGSLTGAGGLLLANFAPLPLFLVGFMSGARSLVVAGAAGCHWRRCGDYGRLSGAPGALQSQDGIRCRTDTVRYWERVYRSAAEEGACR